MSLKYTQNIKGLDWNMRGGDIQRVDVFWNATKIYEVEIDLSKENFPIKLIYPLVPGRSDSFEYNDNVSRAKFLGCLTEGVTAFK